MDKPIYTIEIPEGIDQEDLDLLLTALENIHKAKIKLVDVLRTNSATCAQALDFIFANNARDIPAEQGQASKNGKEKKRRSLPAWKDEATGETFSTQSLNKRLAKHALRLGTKLHHPKHGRMVVVAGEPDEPDKLMDIGKWEKNHE